VSQERLAAMESCCRSVRTVQYRGFAPSRLKALLGFFSARPRFLIDTYNREMHALVERASMENSFDVVIASQIDSAPYALLLPDTPRVLEELAVSYERFACQRSLVPRARYRLTWWKLSQYVPRLLRQFEGCTVVSDREVSLVKGTAPEYDALAVVPNGVDLEANTGDFGAPRPDTLIYSGALTYDANFDAMEFFLHDIFPLVKAQRPNVHMSITGGYDGVPVSRLPVEDGVELTGYLPDIRPAVAQSWVSVVPLRMGGGTRLKILEAMALGTPVISTSKGAEGLKVTHEKNILIADESGSFAQAVIRMLEDEELRARLSASGRRLVEEHYSWDTCAGQLEQLLCQVVKQARGPSRRSHGKRSFIRGG
jgi:glycosyltransferase involved in cell wall biosynthesis